MTVSHIGPIPLGVWHEPSSVSVTGAPTSRGGLPISCSLVMASRTDAERIVEMVAEPGRRQRFDGVEGVLEWVQASAAMARWAGWWLVADASLDLGARQHRRGADDAYLSVSVEAVFYGPSSLPAVVATHRLAENDFTLTGQPLLVAPYPAQRLDDTTGQFLREDAEGTLGLYTTNDKRRVVRLQNLAPSLVARRPALVDGAGLHHYGAGAEVVGLAASTFRATLDPATGDIACEADLVDLGNLRIQRGTTTGLASRLRHVVGAEVSDDAVALTLAADEGRSEARLEIRAGDYGLRVFGVRQSHTLDTDAVFATLAANYYRELTAGPGGGRRLVALRRTAVGTNLANGTVTIGAGHLAFFGFEPASPATNDTAAEQAKQALADRDQLLVIER